MKIAVIGATGNLGSAVAAEVARRGHDLTPLNSRTMDVTDPISIKAATVGQDAVVVAVKGTNRLVPRAAQALLAADVNRLIFVGGGGSLEYAPGHRFVDSPDFPAEYLETARDQAEALDIFRASHTSTAWSYISPPPMYLIPGPRTGAYRTEATDTPLADETGKSTISTGDFASAILDSLETDTYIRLRFTAAY